MRTMAIKYQFFGYYFPKQCGPHWRVLTVTVEARCSIEVVLEASGIFPVNFHTKCLLWHVHVHFDCAGSHKTGVAGYRSGIFPVNYRAKSLLWHVHVHFDCAGSHKTGVAGYGSGIFPSCDMSMCISIAQGRKKRVSRDTGPAFSL